MTSKPGTKLLTELLALEGVKVVAHSRYEALGIILHLEAELKEGICPRCGRKSHRLHQNHRYLVKDLPLSGQPVYLEVNRRQFKCQKCCRPFSEELDYVPARRHYTKRLAMEIVGQVLENDIQSVAKRSHVSSEEIETMLKDAAGASLISQPSELKRLGIDEIALVKGQGNYCAVFVDLDKAKLIAIISSRTQEKVREVLQGWGTEVLEQIEEVSIDLWKPYKTLVEELMPAAQVVADRFHVMKQVSDELNRQRKQEKVRAEKQKNHLGTEVLSELKQSKYVLLKNEESLNQQQKIKLEAVKKAFPTLAMHELKEKFRAIFQQDTDWLTGLFSLGEWLNLAAEHFPQSQKTIKRWLDEILAYFDRRTTNGVVEGINNKLKLIKRQGKRI